MKVNIVEVGPRDGLQNEARPVSTEQKQLLIASLIKAGVREMEVGAFVRADRVPQMADTEALLASLKKSSARIPALRTWTLVPNQKGMERAVAAGVKNVAIFTAATDSFAKKNIGMSVAESLEEFSHVMKIAAAHKMRVRGYVSTAFGCPFEGRVASVKPLKVIDRLIKLGVTQVSVGDTIGVANPRSIEAVFKPALRNFGVARLAGHFHDTRGTALANALRALDLGVRTLDASAGGLGGCPYAPGASGNLATEDLVYMLREMGIQTGIDLSLLAKGTLDFLKMIGRPAQSRFLLAFQSGKSHPCFI